MNILLQWLLDAGIIYGLASLLPSVTIKNFGTALLVAALLAVLNFFIGWIIRFPLNLVSFFLLSGIVRLVVAAILLKLIDNFLSDFEIKGFWPALLIALAITLAGSLIDRQVPTERMIQSGFVAAG